MISKKLLFLISLKYVGQSEQRVRKMIQVAEALAPCVLWVDEIDKAFAGAVIFPTESNT